MGREGGDGSACADEPGDRAPTASPAGRNEKLPDENSLLAWLLLLLWLDGLLASPAACLLAGLFADDPHPQEPMVCLAFP